MKQYHKIENIFNRDTISNKLIEGEYRCLRCGINREDKLYGVCALYGTVEKRHIWVEFKGETETIELNDLLTSKDR